MARARAPLSFADGAAEAAVFAAAMEATISGATVDASEDDCTDLSRRRNLLQAGSAELDFTVTVSGADAASATTTSIAAVVTAAVDSGAFETALADAAAALDVADFVALTVSGIVAVFAPTASPVVAAPAPTASPITPVLEGGSWRLAPGAGLLVTCIAALATAWI